MSSIHRSPFYFLCHGLTAAALQDITCGGDWDIPLHAAGLRQAEALAAVFRTLVPQVNRVVSSPMLRARETAEAITGGSGRAVEIEEDLRDWRLGTWDRAPWPAVKPRMLASADPPNGEPSSDFKRRVVAAVNRVLLRKPSTPLLVSHEAVAHVLFSALEIDTTPIDSCLLYRVAPGHTRWYVTPMIQEVSYSRRLTYSPA